MNKYKKDLYALLFLLFLIVVFNYRLFYPSLSFFSNPDFGHSDLLHGFYPLKLFLAESLKNGSIHFWSKDMGSGYPVFADGQIGTFAIINLVAFTIFSFVTALNVVYLFSFLIAGIGMYLLARSFNVARPSSLFSAVVFTFSGFMISQVNHMSLFQGAAFLPFQLFFAHLLIKKTRPIPFAALAFITSQQILTGNPQMAVFSLTAVLLFYITICAVEKPKEITPKLFVLASSLFLALTASAVLLLPTFELYTQSTRTGVTGLYQYFPFPLKHIITFIFPYFFGSPQFGTYPRFGENWGIFWENNGYIGLIPFFLLLIGLSMKKKIHVLALYLLIFFSLLLVLGKYSPFYIIYQIPPWSLFRVPSRFLLMTAAFLSLLCAIVLDNLTKSKRISRANGDLLVYSLIIAHFITVCFYFINYNPTLPSETLLSSPKTVDYFKKNASEGRLYTFETFDRWNAIFLKEGWKKPEQYVQFNEAILGTANLYYAIPKANPDASFRLKRQNLVFDYFYSALSLVPEKKVTFSDTSLKILGISATKYILTDGALAVEPHLEIKKIGIYSFYSNPYYAPRVRFVKNPLYIEALINLDNLFKINLLTQKKQHLSKTNLFLLFQTVKKTVRQRQR
jgi:hypothetical protein